jgi:hypothetical protein
LRELKKLERGVRVPVQIPLDEHGFIDRRCPSPECGAEFKVAHDDWRTKVSDKVVFCPICRQEAPATEWNTAGQERHIRQVAMAHLHKTVDDAMRDDVRGFNARQPRGGLISMSMTFRPGPAPILIPIAAAEELRQQFACEACGCRYSSLGAAFFCPACGHNSAQTTFATAVKTVRTSVANLEQIRAAVEAAADKDAAENTSRQILENGLVKLVASFQRFAEAMFHRMPGAASVRVRKNLFQNLDESSRVWKEATGTGYEDLLTVREMADLVLCFQQRHLLAHKEGIVDQEYRDKSGDLSYSVGQRLVVKDQAVLRFAELVEKLSTGLGGLS